MTAFRTRRELPNRPDEVWRALVEAELLGRWFMASDADLGPGVRFTLHDPQARGWSGRLRCAVEDFEPPRRLRYRAEEVDGPSVTTLTWILTPSGRGTALELEHAGWEGVRGWLTGMALKLGWSSLVARRLPDALAAPR